MTHTIDDLIRAHWGDTIVLRGETPEAYASRREEARLGQLVMGWDVGSQAPVVFVVGPGGRDLDVYAL